MKKILILIILSLFISSHSYAFKIKIPVRIIPVPGVEEQKNDTKKIDADKFLKAMCFPMAGPDKIMPEFKKICEEKFPKNKISTDKDLKCVLTASSYENPQNNNIILKTHKIYRGNFSTVSVKKLGLNEEPRIYFADLNDDELGFFSINEEKKVMTVFQLLRLQDGQRTFLIHDLNLTEVNISHLYPNKNSIYDNFINDENSADITGKLLNKEIKFLSNRLDELKLNILKEEQLMKQYIAANTYTCSQLI